MASCLAWPRGMGGRCSRGGGGRAAHASQSEQGVAQTNEGGRRRAGAKTQSHSCIIIHSHPTPRLGAPASLGRHMPPVGAVLPTNEYCT